MRAAASAPEIVVQATREGTLTAALICWPRSQTYSATACSTAAGVTAPPTPVFVATAQGNIDADATMDQWSISSNSRVFTAGGSCTADANNPSGEPANDLN